MRAPHESNTQPLSRDDARRRFVRLLRIMAIVTVVAVAAALIWLRATDTPMTLHVVAAAVLAVVGSMALAAILMGLVFFSHSSGADSEASHLDD